MSVLPSTGTDLCSRQRFWVFNPLFSPIAELGPISDPQRLSTRDWETYCGKGWRLRILGCVLVGLSLAQLLSVSQSLKSTKANDSLLHTERQVEGCIGLQAVICQPLISANLPGAPGC